jgi:hypothetical protein
MFLLIRCFHQSLKFFERRPAVNALLGQPRGFAQVAGSAPDVERRGCVGDDEGARFVAPLARKH